MIPRLVTIAQPMIWMMRKVIDVYATAQKHGIKGMSMTLFMRSDIPEGLYEWKETSKQDNP